MNLSLEGLIPKKRLDNTTKNMLQYKHGDKMISNWIIKFLCFQYIVVMAVCLFEHRWVTALYWFGATILNIGVLLGMK